MFRSTLRRVFRKQVTTISRAIQLNRIKNSIFFDMDGVLCDSEYINMLSHRQAIYNLSFKYGIYVAPIADRFISSLVQGLPYSHALNNIMSTFPKLLPYQTEYIEYSSKVFLNLKKSMANDYFIASSVAFLNLLLENEYKVCIVSGSKHDEIMENLKQMQLVRYEIPIIGVEDYVSAKPDPEPYLKAAEILGVTANKDCVVIEDSPLGIRSGKKAGMFVIAVTTSHDESRICSEKPDMLIDDLSNLCVNSDFVATPKFM